MKLPLPILLSAALIFSACSKPTYTSIDQENRNPLVASRYGDELASVLADLIIRENPIVQKEGMKERIQKEIEDAKNLAQAGRERYEGAMMGPILMMQMEGVGYVAYKDDTLFISSDFFTKPGPNLHVYLTSAVDPREGEFPDETAIDLGVIQTTYGAQEYAVPPQEDPTTLRTFVLWDKSLGILYSFAQLSVRD